jgi:hypothetical protein
MKEGANLAALLLILRGFGEKMQKDTFPFFIFQFGLKSGAGDGDRTRDIQLGKLAFYR